MWQDNRTTLILGACFLLLWATNIGADVPGLRFARHPVSTVAVPGAEVVLECALNVSADRVEWRMNGNPLPATANRANGRLVLRLAKEREDYKQQTGSYQCIAWFGASAMASQPAEVSIAHLEEPTSSSLTSTVHTSTGNAVYLTCPPPPSTPPAQITFRRDGHHLSVPVSDQGGLLLTNVTPADNGRYTCSATNTVTDLTVSMPINFQLQVEANPRHSSPAHLPLPMPTNYTILAGKDVTLVCPASGWPVPTFTWAKYGGSLPPDRTDIVPGALIISKVSKVDEGTYTSEARNSAGQPVRCIIALYVMEVPHITKEPSSQTVEEGGDVQLDCSARGWPTPEMKWLLNGDSVDRDPLISVMGSRLSIRRVEKRHAGIFQCFAISPLGSSFGIAMLHVNPKTINSRPHSEDSDDEDEFEERPRGRGRDRNDRRRKDKRKDRRPKGNDVMIPPTSPNITRLSDESVMVRWDLQSEGGLTIQFFKVQFKDLTEQGRWNTIDADIRPHDRTTEVDSLKPGHSYKFRISAVYSNNDNKQGPNSAKFHLQREPTTKKPLYAPTITSGEATSPSSITLQWDYTSVPSVPIEGFFIYYRSSTMAGDYTKATAIGENTRSYLITHLLPDNSYDIKIQAFNNAGTSGFSDLRYYRTLYVATTEEPSSIPSMPGGGGLGVGLGNEGSSQPLGLILGIIFGGLLLLIVLLFLGVYFCKHASSRTAAAEHEPGKEAQAYGLVSVGKPLTNGTTHHVHQIRHTHRHQQRVHITSNPLASTTEHFKVESVVEVASQNNNCSDPARRRLRTNSLNDDEDEGTSGSEGAGGSSEEEAPPVPPRQCDNYV